MKIKRNNKVSCLNRIAKCHRFYLYYLLKEKKSDLQQERSTTLAQHYLLQAYAMVGTNRSGAWKYFKKAWQKAPRQALKKSSWGLIRELCENFL